jgi:microcystin-dependent protein
MSQPFIGQISFFSFNFAPRSWATCDGQLLAIAQNQALFALLGTTYGGNGTTTFALPNLQGRVPLHVGPGFTQGQAGGEENHTLTLPEIPSHGHGAPAAATTATTGSPAGAVWANSGHVDFASVSNSAMAAAAIGATGGGQPHPNMSPFLVINICIALAGIFPSRN